MIKSKLPNITQEGMNRKQAMILLNKHAEGIEIKSFQGMKSQYSIIYKNTIIGTFDLLNNDKGSIDFYIHESLYTTSLRLYDFLQVDNILLYTQSSVESLVNRLNEVITDYNY